MIIYHDPDAWVPESEHHTCEIHRKCPKKDFAGCTCWSNYSLRMATPEEYRKNRLKRLLAERKELEDRLDWINLALEGEHHD
jgi:hypothetical protein